MNLFSNKQCDRKRFSLLRKNAENRFLYGNFGKNGCFCRMKPFVLKNSCNSGGLMLFLFSLTT